MIGGVAIGALMHGLSIGDAFRQYALLTIGDGLVAQIPALLLSAAAAILVTRISDSGDFEKQVSGQLLAQPTVLFSAAGVMVILALVPGMPWFSSSPSPACSATSATGCRARSRRQDSECGGDRGRAARRPRAGPRLAAAAGGAADLGGGRLQAGAPGRQERRARSCDQAHQGRAPEPVRANGPAAAADRRARRPDAAPEPVRDLA
jgi:hypothetical protein